MACDEPDTPIGEGSRPASCFGRVSAVVFESKRAASTAVAQEIAELIQMKAQRRETAVLGLATGSTPWGVYDELVRLHREEGLSLKNVVTFNLDEYWPMKPGDSQSFHNYMAQSLFEHVDIELENIHIPDGTLPLHQIAAYCEEYETSISEAGGIDYQILGIGQNGHIGFNEPGSARHSRTRLVTLDEVTRTEIAADFPAEASVPRKAITMGVGTILEARRIVLLAFGRQKAPIVRRAVEGEVADSFTASFTQEHPDARFVLDRAAAAELARSETRGSSG